MATRPGFIPIGETGEFLDSVQVDTPAGDDLHRETVVFADPENPAGLAKVTNTTPAPDAYGGVVRVVGAVDVVTETTKVVIPADQSLELDFVGGAYQTGDAQLTAEVVYVGNLSLPLPAGAATAAKQLPDNHQVQVSNFPATQAVSGTVSVDNFPSTQDVIGTVTANLGALNGAATAANQTAGNASLASLDGKLPDLSGTWGYDAGVSGSVTIGAGKRVCQITAVAGALGATVTINGGSTVTIPALTSLTIEPRANLIAPSLVFTGTAAYFVEHVI